jgi:myo-inositol 2-dehydrogenase / D-chiro-inositol 1-dehydrogenase
MEEKNKQSRRDFLSTVALGAVGTMGAVSVLSGCSSSLNIKRPEDGTHLSLLEQAPDGEVLKAGLVGCGGRGTGAAVNFVDAGPNLEIVAIGDAFQDQLDRCRHTLKQARNIEIDDDKCFVGLDCYKQIIDSDIDVILLASPPNFRPREVKAAIEAGIHVFQEKPVAVDPVGARVMMEVTEQAKQKNLCMVSGTIRRYEKNYIETQRRVAQGQIGEVVSANIIRNGGALWWVERKDEWSDLEYMLRNWGNYNWLSGDHIIEQYIHELDVMSWHLGSHPVKAMGYGGRQQRISGDLYDHFSIVYEYEGGRKVNCFCRQINGCDNGKVEKIVGTEGYADASGTIYNHKGEIVWEYPFPSQNDENQTWRVNNPYVQEHVELVTAIRTGNYLNDSDEQIKSTLIGIMGRMAAYSGNEITWDQVVNSDLDLSPDVISFDASYNIPDSPPLAGAAPAPTDRYA